MKKRKKLAIAVLSALSAATLAVGVGCTPKKTSDGSEYGVYYYEWDGEEYLVTLSEGEKFTFCVDGENRTGTYRLDAGKLTLKFGKKDVIEAEMNADVLTLTYNESEMRFLKRTAYTVEFEENGGSEIASVRVINGKTLARPEESVKSGYTFIGWYADAEYTKPFIFGSDIITGDTTLYAYWVQNTGASEYVVNFDLNYENAEALESRTTVGGKLYEIPTPVREGYDFNGWWVSVYNDASKLTYRYTSETMLTEDTTLYASWKETGSRKLDAPVVRIESNRIVWEGVNGATGYRVVVADASGKELLNTTGNLSVNFDFGKQAAGDYVVTVTAMASASANNAESVIYYKNKALGKVSNFSVVEGTTLLYGAVDNAEHYIITVECGNAHHNHTEFDNGTATSYNFTNCTPKADGTITFTVVATAEGYASGTASSYSHSKVLSKIERLYTDSATDTISWDGVANATRYIVAVNGKRIDVGTKTSYSLAEYEAGEIEVSVYPETEGYISPEATSVKYVKTSVAKPTELKIVDETLTWNAVSGATYEVRVNDANAVAANTNEFDLSAYNLTQDRDHVIAVRAIKGSSASAWTEIVVRSNAMSETLRYGGGKVSWTLAIGATAYEVSVNGRVQKTVTDGSNEAEVTLDRAGTNVIGVRYTDGANYSTAASIEVYAHRVYYYSNGGAGSEEQYKAVGDPMTPPEVTRAGYDFEGWYNVPGGAESNGKKYEDAIFREAGEIMLFAYYTPKTYKATLNAQGGIMDATVEEVVYRTSDFKFAVPTAASATDAFDGWYTQQGGQGIRLTDAEGRGVARWDMARDAEIYANWINNVFEFLPLSDGTYSVKKGTNIGSITTAVVPETYNGKPVTVVEGYAFESCSNLLHISIPDTVKIIETNTAFNKCTKLQTVDIYKVDGNTQRTYWSEGGVIFAYNDVTAATEISYVPAAMTGDYVIPDGVTTIPMKAFSGTKITSVVIPTSVTQIEMNAFYNCKALQVVEFVTGGANELQFSDNAFNGCSLLTSITLPARTGEFTTTVFEKCTGLKAIYVEAGNLYYSSVDGMLCTADGGTLIYAPAGISGRIVVPLGVTSVADKAFYQNKGIRRVVIPGYVISIGEDVFGGCVALEEVVFQNNAVQDMTIGARAFKACTNLKTVTFEKGCRVSEIGVEAFYSDPIREVNIPSATKKIADSAFAKCANLRAVTLEGGTEELVFGENVFLDCNALTTVELSENVKEFNPGIFSGCKYLDTITVNPNNPNFADVDGVLYNNDKTILIFYPKSRTGEIEFADTIETIGDSAFEGFGDIESLTVPATVKTIGNRAFFQCTALKKLYFAEGSVLETIGDMAFANSIIEMEVLTFPASLKVIGDRAFTQGTVSSTGAYSVASRESLAINSIQFGKEGETSLLTSIGVQAFSRVKLRGTIKFPASLVTIKDNAFDYCNGIQRVEFAPNSAATGEDWGTTVFGQSSSSSWLSVAPSMASAVLPDSFTMIPRNLFNGCKALKSVEIPSKVQTIAFNAFYNSGLEGKVTIPASVKVIESGSFGGTAISELYCEENSQLEVIEETAFARCPNLKKVHLGESIKDVGFNMNSIKSHVFEGSPIEVLTIAEENEVLKSVNNAIFSKDGTKLYYVASAIVENEGFTGFEIPNTVTYIDSRAFSSSQLLTVTFEDGTEDLQIGVKNNFSRVFDKAALTTITIPYRTVLLGGYAFNNCANLKEIIFEGMASKPNGEEESVESGETDENALADADTETGGETSAETPSPRIHTIWNYAFYGCSSLKTFVFPKSVTTLGTLSMFTKCYSMESISFEEGTTITDFPAMSIAVEKTGNPAKTTITIPKSVTTLAASVFSSATNVKEVVFEEGIQLEDIPHQAFYKSGITKIVIPKSVKSIGKTGNASPNQVFGNCASLVSVEFEEGSALEFIGTTSFNGCSKLESVTGIPNSLTTIKSAAFQSCSKLQTFEFADENFVENSGLKTVEDSAFKNSFKTCTNLVDFKFPNALTSLGKEVFSGATKLKSVDFGNNTSITGFGNGVFASCTNLEKIVLPSSFTGITDYRSFNGCSKLATFEVASSDTATSGITVGEDGVVYRDNLLLLYPVGKTATAFTIPETVTGIANGAFAYVKNLKTLEISGSVETIGQYAFRYCTGLTSLTFASGTAALTIGNQAFMNCTGINTDVTIPARAISLGTEVFSGVNKMTGVSFESNSQLTSIPDKAFSSCSKLTKVENMPSGVTEIGVSAFATCPLLAKLTFADVETSKLQTIGNSAFSGCFKTCTNDVSIELPASVTTFGTSVFENATKLKSISFGSNSKLETIGNNSFKATGLTELTLPNSVKSLGNNVFQNCKSLETVVLSNSLETMGNSVFSGCSSISEITLPASLMAIGTQVFENCTSLTEVAFADGCGLSEIPKGTFKGCSALGSVDFGTNNTSVVTIGAEAFMNCGALQSVVIPSEVTNIADSAFNGCAALTTVEIPDKVAVIGNSVFSGCAKLSEIVLPSALETLGENVFLGCTALESFDLSEYNTEFALVDGILYNSDQTAIIYLPPTISGEIVIPNTVMEIAEGAFAGTKVTKVTLPLSVMTVSASLFEGCENLTEVVLHNRIASIEAKAFKGCTALQSITIPGSVTSIGESAFENCSILSDIEFARGSDRLTIGKAAFKNCVAIESITIPSRIRGFGDNGTYHAAIGESCFEGCIKLSDIKFDTTVATGISTGLGFGTAAFKGCIALVTITLPAHFFDTYSGGYYSSPVSAIGNNCFEDCVNLTTVNFPTNTSDSKIGIGSESFKNCTSLTQIQLPEYLNGIRDRAFTGTSLTSIVIPSTVTSNYSYGLGSGVFKDCKELVSVEVKSTGLVTIMSELFFGCSKLSSLTLASADKITKINANAFDGCTSLASFTVPSTVTTMGANVFNGWGAGQSIVMSIPQSAIPSGWNAEWYAGSAATVTWAAEPPAEAENGN